MDVAAEPYDLTAAVEAHCLLFNQCFRAGDWTPLVATFTDDAEMVFTNVPIPPVVGRDAIAAAYAANPPTDTMHVRGVEPVDLATASVRFGWEAGGEGTMVLRWRDGLVSALQVTFD
jgi:hypothetical protein